MYKYSVDTTYDLGEYLVVKYLGVSIYRRSPGKVLPEDRFSNTSLDAGIRSIAYLLLRVLIYIVLRVLPSSSSSSIHTPFRPIGMSEPLQTSYKGNRAL
jgi:hypothetical protein